MAQRKGLEATDFTATTNNLLHSLFTQCWITLNGTTLTPMSDLYEYRYSLDTLVTYGSDQAIWHLTSGFLYLDSEDLQPCESTTA